MLPGKFGNNIKMKVLITGNLGYVGSELVKYLRNSYPKCFIAGFDTGYFNNLLTTTEPPPERCLDLQYYGDVRNFDFNILDGYDYVVHLAAISNDPMGNEFKKVTYDINFSFSAELVKESISRNIKRFVFASSCSVYGTDENKARDENSELNPLTEYAISKVNTEKTIKNSDIGNTIFTCLRFATACGYSDRLRLDLVLNDFVASALINNRIDILSDGSPLRPLINVSDMCKAIDWALNRNINAGGQNLICNAGSNEWNYSIKELAINVQKNFKNCELNINENSSPDKRSYKVDFNLFYELADPKYIPSSSLESTIKGLKEGLEKISFNNKSFRESNLIRLNVLNSLRKKKYLDELLFWRL